jgi:DNA polymerase-1
MRLAGLIIKSRLASDDVPSGTDSTRGVSVMRHDDIDNLARPFYDSLSQRGIPLNLETLRSQKDVEQKKLDAILHDLEQKFGFLPNPNRSDDYAKIAQMKGYPLPTTPTGRPKTDEWTIARAEKQVPELKSLQQARSVRRRVSILTNLESVARDNRVYPTYSLDPTLGRTHSGGDANPMNFSPEIEQPHVAIPGHSILVADYSRIEPKVLAFLSQDNQLQQDLKGDPYYSLAKTAFNTPNPTPDQRNKGKVAFLAMIYGTTPKGLAAQLSIPLYAAEKIMAAWHKRYPGASSFIKQSIEEGRNQGYAESFHGRRKPLDKPDPEANDRLAFNSKIQNTSGDLSRIGFTNAASNSELKQLGVEILTTVHDSLVMSVPHGANLDRIKSLLKYEMVDRNDPRFDLAVEFKLGDTWATVK